MLGETEDGERRQAEEKGGSQSQGKAQNRRRRKLIEITLWKSGRTDVFFLDDRIQNFHEQVEEFKSLRSALNYFVYIIQ